MVVKALPITLLSGFLGAGKTTLLKYILQSKDHGYRCAVIVNDMAARNIDAGLVKNMVQKKEKLVSMENGCICCTLRGDLLEEVYNLAKQGSFDCIIIESTGISEPMQVAETFTTEFVQDAIEHGDSEEDQQFKKTYDALIELGGINKIARLDTCVTVIDALNFLDTFDSSEVLDDGTERTITNLMVDQIEFADVILVNKTDMVSKKVLGKISTIVKSLNPVAEVLQTKHSVAPLDKILNTGKFDFETASTSAGWLRSLGEMTTQSNGKRAPVPETVEYGITSFVYSRKRPFHPMRLGGLLDSRFLMMQDDPPPEEAAEEDAEGEDDKEKSEGEDEDEHADTPQATPQEIVEAKKKDKSFGPVLRSKGSFWLATRPMAAGEWSQAGCMLTIRAGQTFYACMDEEDWEPELRDAIKKAMDGEWGDRRQKIVFIGAGLDQALLESTLDACLLTDAEMKKWEVVMRSTNDIDTLHDGLLDLFDDAFEPWMISIEEVEEDEEAEDSAVEAAGAACEMKPKPKKRESAASKKDNDQAPKKRERAASKKDQGQPPKKTKKKV